MLDWQGIILEKRYRQRIMLSDIEADLMMVESLKTIKDESNVIDNIIMRQIYHTTYQNLQIKSPVC